MNTRRFFLRQAALAPFTLWLPEAAQAASSALPRATPESQGVDPRGVLAFLDAVEREKFELHSLMILRHGQVVAEGWWAPYGPEFVHTMYSMSKSFTSTAVGLAVAEGRLTVEDRVVSFFPDKLPEKVSENLAAMRVKDLLTMSSGHEKEPTQACVRSEDWARTFLAQNIAHAPGTQFMYNSAATYLCAAIVQKLTGQTLLDYLTPRLFEPLGISGMRWESCPLGVNTGGWGLSLQTEGMAKFGQLLLQKGQWQGRQLIPAAWVEEATRFHIQQPGGDKPDRPQARNDWLQGYGYQFWRCQGTGFRGDGAFGQFTIVLPEQDAVIAMTSENKDMQGQLDLVWQHLLPALAEKPLPAGKTVLGSRLAGLKLPVQPGIAPPALAARISGRAFTLEPNDLGIEALTVTFEKGMCMAGLRVGGKLQVITHGEGHWHRGEAAVPGTPPRLISGGAPKAGTPSKIAAQAAWTSPATLKLTWRYYETPHHDTLVCEFMDDRVEVMFLNSITAMNPKAKDSRAPLLGRLA